MTDSTEEKLDHVEEDEAFIHSLPNELLVMIFSFLSVEDLCSSISRVCVRWREAMRFKSLWNDKELNYEYGNEDGFLIGLSIAPCLRKLTVTPYICSNPIQIVKAILKGPKDVLEIDYNLATFPSINVEARFLNHFKDHVEKLHYQGHSHEGDFGDQKRDYSSIGEMLGQMCNLRSLTVSGKIQTIWKRDCLQKGCLKLKHIDLSNVQSVSGNPEILLDVIKSQLITLKLPLFTKMIFRPAMFESCSKLREITLRLNDLRCIENLPSLRCLNIMSRDDTSTATVNQFIRYSLIFESIEELFLHFIPGDVAKSIAKRCCNLKVLKLSGINSTSEIIKHIPSVQKLSIVNGFDLRMRHVQRLPRYSPNLNHLTILKSLNHKGIPPKIINELTKQLPGLDVVSDKFTIYSKSKTKPGFSKNFLRRGVDSSTDCSSDEAETQ